MDALLNEVIEFLERHAMEPWRIALELVQMRRSGLPWPEATQEQWIAAIDHGVKTGRLVQDGNKVRLAPKPVETKQDAAQMELF